VRDPLSSEWRAAAVGVGVRAGNLANGLVLRALRHVFSKPLAMIRRQRVKGAGERLKSARNRGKRPGRGRTNTAPQRLKDPEQADKSLPRGSQIGKILQLGNPLRAIARTPDKGRKR
jgi:hypothetical protein